LRTAGFSLWVLACIGTSLGRVQRGLPKLSAGTYEEAGPVIRPTLAWACAEVDIGRSTRVNRILGDSGFHWSDYACPFASVLSDQSHSRQKNFNGAPRFSSTPLRKTRRRGPRFSRTLRQAQGRLRAPRSWSRLSGNRRSFDCGLSRCSTPPLRMTVFVWPQVPSPSLCSGSGQALRLRPTRGRGYPIGIPPSCAEICTCSRGPLIP